MNNLYINLKKKVHPYAEEKSSKKEIWCEMNFLVADIITKVKTEILKLEWNLLEPLSWFISNRRNLLDMLPPIEIVDGSIAKSLFLFYEQYDPEIDFQNEIEKIYQYRTSHDLVFAFRGLSINNIVFGVVDNNFTVSRYDENVDWCYKINSLNFFEHIQEIHNEFVGK